MMTPPEQGGPVTSLPGFLLVVALTVGAFWIGEIPLPVARPPADTFAPDRYAGVQQYDARLWQDPFEVLRKTGSAARDDQGIDAAFGTVTRLIQVLDRQPRLEAPGEPQPWDVCNTFAREEMQRQAADIVVAVMVPGEPYAEDAEVRRRIRYAVVSGLAHSGYTPHNGRHMGVVNATLNTAGMPRSVQVPFEWFRPGPDNDGQLPVLLLWVNEAPVRKRPLQGLQQIVQGACGCLASPDVVVLGPADSDTLHAMLQEAGETAADAHFPFMLHFYSPRATADDALLLQGLAPVAKPDAPREGIAGFLAASWLAGRVTFQRTIARDQELVQALVKELGLRGVQAGDGVILVSEWDTLYGRALPQRFTQAMLLQHNQADHPAGEAVNEQVCGRASICRFSYLRGLDGMLPGEFAARKGETGGKAAERDKPSIEAVYGNQRIDYLRRIALRIADLDQEMKTNGRREGVKAIGVLGSDVYDKLLILRALRSRFPEAIFFTTDLDARLLHPSERAAARNLVVAAGYGLRLNGWLQRDIPDFRDSYQSAYFLSVQLALRDQANGHNGERIRPDAWYAQPRMFEIGRSRPVDLSLTAGNSARCELASCESPHPGAPTPAGLAWYSVVPLLFLLFFWYAPNRAVVAAFLHEAGRGIAEPLRRSPGPWYRQLNHMLTNRWLWGLLLASLFAWWLGWEFYRMGSNIFPAAAAADGEPFFWFEGVSIWPSVMLRALAGLLALYFLLRGMYSLRRNDQEITGEFFTDHKNTVLARARPSLAERLWHCLVRARFCRVCLLGWLPRRVAGVQRRYAKALFLWRDAVQPYTRLALLGRMLLTLVLVMAFLIPLLKLFPFEPPNTPFRGPESKSINDDMLRFAVLSFLLLLAFVIDTTRRTARLARALGRQAVWPENALQKAGCSGGGEQYCEEWLNIQLIAARTEVVGRFVYYPFIVLSLIIVSRSPIIDNWQISPMLAMIFSFYLGVLIVCTLLLRKAAETARRNMLRSLTRKIIEARGNDAPDHRINHLETMKNDIRAERRGTFSSYLDQPWLKALLLPIGSYSGLQLIEYLSYLRA